MSRAHRHRAHKFWRLPLAIGGAFLVVGCRADTPRQALRPDSITIHVERGDSQRTIATTQYQGRSTLLSDSSTKGFFVIRDSAELENVLRLLGYTVPSIDFGREYAGVVISPRSPATRALTALRIEDDTFEMMVMQETGVVRNGELDFGPLSDTAFVAVVTIPNSVLITNTGSINIDCLARAVRRRPRPVCRAASTRPTGVSP